MTKEKLIKQLDGEDLEFIKLVIDKKNKIINIYVSDEKMSTPDICEFLMAGIHLMLEKLRKK